MSQETSFKKEAIMAVEESGIVFIDEIDKICTSQDFVLTSLMKLRVIT